MPFVFALVGILLLVVAIQGTQGQAFTMLKGEFSGSNSFIVWASAIIILGALAYIKPIRPVAMAMIGLVLLGLVLANKGGFFTQLNNALRNPVAPAATPTSNTTTGSSLSQSYGGTVTAPGQPTPANPFGLGSGGTLNPTIAPETIPYAM